VCVCVCVCVCVETFIVQVQHISGYLADTHTHTKEEWNFFILSSPPCSPPLIPNLTILSPPLPPCSPVFVSYSNYQPPLCLTSLIVYPCIGSVVCEEWVRVGNGILDYKRKRDGNLDGAEKRGNCCILCWSHWMAGPLTSVTMATPRSFVVSSCAQSIVRQNSNRDPASQWNPPSSHILILYTHRLQHCSSVSQTTQYANSHAGISQFEKKMFPRNGSINP